MAIFKQDNLLENENELLNENPLSTENQVLETQEQVLSSSQNANADYTNAEVVASAQEESVFKYTEKTADDVSSGARASEPYIYTNTQSSHQFSNSNSNNSFENKGTKPAKQKKSLSFAQIIAITLIGCITLGLSAGFGYNFSKNYFAKNEAPVANPNSKYFVDSSTVEVLQNNRQNMNSIPDIYDEIKDSIVAITSKQLSQDFFYNQVEVPTSGTGVVFNISSDSIMIVTNNHVVGKTKDIMVAFEDNKNIPATIVGKDSDTDLAVIKIQKSDVAKEVLAKIKPVVFADSDKARVGEAVIAIGNPLGYNKTTSFGIISGLDRHTELTGERLSLLQTDASINPGNSGGALVNMNGEVVGINTQKISTSAAEGIGFSIPSNTVKKVINDLVDKGFVSKPFLGISATSITPEISKSYNVPEGIWIRGVLKGTAASKAGLKVDDIIISCDGEAINSMSELSDIIAKKKIGDKIKIGIIREQQGKMSFDITLQDKPSNLDN